MSRHSGYIQLLEALGTNDAEIRALIRRADDEGYPSAQRVLLLPARSPGEIYGMVVKLSDNVVLPTIEVPVTQKRRIS